MYPAPSCSEVHVAPGSGYSTATMAGCHQQWTAFPESTYYSTPSPDDACRYAISSAREEEDGPLGRLEVAGGGLFRRSAVPRLPLSAIAQTLTPYTHVDATSSTHLRQYECHGQTGSGNAVDGMERSAYRSDDEEEMSEHVDASLSQPGASATSVNDVDDIVLTENLKLFSHILQDLVASSARTSKGKGRECGELFEDGGESSQTSSFFLSCPADEGAVTVNPTPRRNTKRKRSVHNHTAVIMASDEGRTAKQAKTTEVADAPSTSRTRSGAKADTQKLPASPLTMKASAIRVTARKGSRKTIKKPSPLSQSTIPETGHSSHLDDADNASNGPGDTGSQLMDIELETINPSAPQSAILDSSSVLPFPGMDAPPLSIVYLDVTPVRCSVVEGIESIAGTHVVDGVVSDSDGSSSSTQCDEDRPEASPCSDATSTTLTPSPPAQLILLPKESESQPTMLRMSLRPRRQQTPMSKMPIPLTSRLPVERSGSTQRCSTVPREITSEDCPMPTEKSTGRRKTKKMTSAT